MAIQTRAYDPNVARRLTSRDPTFRPEYFQDDMRRYAQDLGLEYVGLETAFRQAYEANQARLTWMHWNYRGHQVVADVLSRKLEFILGSELTN